MSASNPAFEINAIIAAALEKHLDIIRNYTIVSNETDRSKKVELNEKFYRKVEDYLAFIMKSFPMPDPSNHAEHAACLLEMRRAVFIEETDDLKRKALRKELYNIPPTILLQVLPVAFLRDLLCYNKVILKVSRIPSWKKFSDTYTSLIVA